MKKRTVSIVIALFVIGLLLTGLPLQARAGEPTEQVRETVDAVIKILNDKELKKPAKEKERRTAVRKAIEKRFNFEEMAKRSLAAHWKDRTAAEQKEFVALYTDLLENSYIKKIERYENEKVLYTDERVDADYAVVKTKVMDGKNVSIPVDYKIIKKNNRWEVYDIVVEGVSLVNNYRTQFAQIIRAGSYAELVKKLKKKGIKED